MAEASNCVSVSHRIVVTPKVEALIPSRAHGETDDRPSPTPRMSRISDSEAAAAAPAAIAPQDTPLTREWGLCDDAPTAERPRRSSSAGIAVDSGMGRLRDVEVWATKKLHFSLPAIYFRYLLAAVGHCLTATSAVGVC